MNYFTYQHADGTDDVAPDIGNVYTTVVQSFSENNDYLISVARVKARMRGATPLEVERNVNKLAGY